MLSRWKDFLCSQWEDNMAIVNSRLQFQHRLYQNPSSLFAEIGSPILKFICKSEKPRISVTIWKRVNECGGLTQISFKECIRATAVPMVCF